MNNVAPSNGLPLSPITIRSRKYDGSLRDEYTAWVYAEDAETVRVYSPPGTLNYDYRQPRWAAAPDGLVEIYFKTRWYMVQHICEQNSQRNRIYTHLAMPAQWMVDHLAWVDLDLDYQVYLDGTLARIDEPDFEHNQAAMNYPPEVVAQTWAACAEIERLYASGVFPFDHLAQVAVYQSLKAAYEQARAATPTLPPDLVQEAGEAVARLQTPTVKTHHQPPSLSLPPNQKRI